MVTDLVFAETSFRERNSGKPTTPECPARCVACEKPLRLKTAKTVIYEASNYMVLTKEEAFSYPIEIDYWELTLATIGPECAKKVPKEYVFPVDTDPGFIRESYEHFQANRKPCAETGRHHFPTLSGRKESGPNGSYFYIETCSRCGHERRSGPHLPFIVGESMTEHKARRKAAGLE